MYRPERASTNFLFYQVLVDAMLSGTVILTGGILRTSVERFLFI